MHPECIVGSSGKIVVKLELQEGEVVKSCDFLVVTPWIADEKNNTDMPIAQDTLPGVRYFATIGRHTQVWNNGPGIQVSLSSGGLFEAKLVGFLFPQFEARLVGFLFPQIEFCVVISRLDDGTHRNVKFRLGLEQDPDSTTAWRLVARMCE